MICENGEKYQKVSSVVYTFFRNTILKGGKKESVGTTAG